MNIRPLVPILTLVEAIEKASLRLVVQGVYDFRSEAAQIFLNEQDLVADIGEDITREALDRMGTSAIPVRLFGKTDYKRARYVFHPDYAVRQALFVDSKAEKTDGEGTATIQTSQTSMKIMQQRGGISVSVAGTLPSLLHISGEEYLTTTIFVKYNYTADSTGKNELVSMSVICLPNGLLQNTYNPSPVDNIWLAGRNAPSRGEAFRVRIGLAKLKGKATWRVQKIDLNSASPYVWDE